CSNPVLTYYSPDGRVHLSNPHLAQLESDTLYHLALSTKTHNLEAMFGDVKFVCMGGAVKRMREFAEKVAKVLAIDEPLVDLTQASNRYSMFKVGPVLSISVMLECFMQTTFSNYFNFCLQHGMGVSSLSILMHEIIK